MRRNALWFIPLLIVAIILQTSIISRMKLLQGNADVVMLLLAAWGLQENTGGSWIWGILAGFIIGFISGIPWYIYLTSYILVVGISRMLMRKIWEAPLLAMFLIAMVGTLILLFLTYAQLSLFGTSLSLIDVSGEIILPSLLLNLLLSIPVHASISSIANRFIPRGVA